ncbi:MAG: NAD-glutamate dehydrogenase [Thermoanaerobaculia bacterium]|nr:NAD-glutamate dehydrogenase [Thermoanaerobaculia bacterium]
MASNEEQRKQQLIDSLARQARMRLSQTEATDAEEWVRQYYRLVSPDDMVYTQPETLLGGAMTLWQLAETRKPGEAIVRIFNPSQEREGWTLNHTVVEIANDDMPFLVDSVTAEFSRLDRNVHVVIHPVFSIYRDASGRRVGLARDGVTAPAGATLVQESYMHVEIDQETSEADLASIRKDVASVLEDVRAAVTDWQPMRRRLLEVIEGVVRSHAPTPKDELDESVEFLRWLADNNFVLIGYRRYTFHSEEGKDFLRIVDGSGLGVLRNVRAESKERGVQPFAPEFSAFARNRDLLIVAKANSRSTVHRPVHMDRIGIKYFDEKGNLLGEDRFLGLFTSAAYSRSVHEIPLLRHKAKRTIERAGLGATSHDGKALAQILETLPRDEMFQITEDQLFEIAMGVLQLQERQRIALFVRKDIFERFVSCLVYVPRDRYSSAVRERIRVILEEEFSGPVTAFYTQITDSPLARGHFIVRTAPGKVPQFDAKRIEARVANAARTWSDNLRLELVERHGEEKGIEVCKRYGDAFPVAFQERFSAEEAVIDIDGIESLLATGELQIDLYERQLAHGSELRCKLIHGGEVLTLSEMIPHFENMGLKVSLVLPFDVNLPAATTKVHIRDFHLETYGFPIDIEGIRETFREAMRRVWKGEMEDDGFNRLVVQAGLQWHEVVILRAYTKYLRQTGIAFSQQYMEQTATNHPSIAADLVRLFHLKFDPSLTPEQRAEAGGIRKQIESGLEGITNADEDRILRRYLNLVDSTLRTNCYQRDAKGERKEYLSFKLDSKQVAELPSPRPMFEIFVYSTRMEGVHLRGGKVARGGIRWSDRREDFRTEVLGLVKAQMVKNVVIVPVGSKGGFVLKRPPAGREEFQREGVECYKTLLRGMLDITDNFAGASVIPPRDVVRLDPDDPYLVVAADKGTATFSDIANGVSKDYGFWLGDAFASGGSVGYDHKKMGITAKGAWEAVKRHFREHGAGIDIQTTDFTCVGVGDMAGDVFGNGMLLSRHTKLVGAFNHMHIFVDPDPDPETSFAERERLFNLPRSSWADYSAGVLSKGGAIFDRKLKSITVSDEVKERFGLESHTLAPNDMIRVMLTADVDLLWLGGIGTYVKASDETQADARDRANDALRVDATELRCKVVGEGANLGCTQRGRIEFSLAGRRTGAGRINTDAIDNSAGVDTSDHEVNIKILVDSLVAAGELSAERRLTLLADMTDEVGRLVLRDNYEQTQAISAAEALGVAALDLQSRYIRSLERAGRLDRAIEGLPDDETLVERRAEGLGLMRSELAILLAYSKIHLYDELLASDAPDDPVLERELVAYFPKPLQKEFRAGIEKHRLRREIIATCVTNAMINRVGPTFLHQMMEETGRSPGDVARAYTIARDAFDLQTLWHAIEALDNKVPAAVQTKMMLEIAGLVERSTLWLLRRYPVLDTATCIDQFRPRIAALHIALSGVLGEGDWAEVRTRARDIELGGLPTDLALRLASLQKLAAAFDIVRMSLDGGFSAEDVGRVYFALGQRLQLDRLYSAARSGGGDSPWQKAAADALLEDAYACHGRIASKILEAGGSNQSDAVTGWLAARPGVMARIDQFIGDLRGVAAMDLAMITVAVRHLRALADS